MSASAAMRYVGTTDLVFRHRDGGPELRVTRHLGADATRTRFPRPSLVAERDSSAMTTRARSAHLRGSSGLQHGCLN